MSVIPALGRLRHGDYEFKVSLGYKARPCLKTHNQPNKNKETTTNNPKDYTGS
jgi:hypothetical protein